MTNRQKKSAEFCLEGVIDLSSFKANPISRDDIRGIVRFLKQQMGLENVLYFPILQFAENVLPMFIPDYQFEVVPVEEMGAKHGETYPSKKLIRIREDIYMRAARGEGRDRLTVAHEIGHLFLHKEDSIALCRLSPDQKLKPYEDPEWQADAFGGELLASSYLIQNMTTYEVQTKCGVSNAAARNQIRNL
ncbi:ImmA/IrrE family metallo-endopeptidase [Hornefia butyriciproducens]|uniref:ImmA/IrrE family metallo-endopeptidase n=1 Tax=Hornefia butyriciproducens TaxID=2652293 RepID=UPI003F8B8118